MKKLIQQGAEAKIYLDEKENLIVKDRLSKSYRNPELDKKIIKQRTKAEKKLLEKASKIVNAPNPLPLKETSIIKMPFIDGKKLSTSLNNFPLAKQKEIMKKLGEEISKLHKEDIIHGDLTTSNMILVEGEGSYRERHNIDGELNNIENKRNHKDKSSLTKSKEGLKIFIIDFGLGYISKKIEDKAVDLHLLRQALEAKHFENWEELFDEFKKAYSKDYPESRQIFERITAVERRGRYRH